MHTAFFFYPLLLSACFLGVHAEEEPSLLTQAKTGAIQTPGKAPKAAETKEELPVLNGTEEELAMLQNDGYIFKLNLQTGSGITITTYPFHASDAEVGCGGDNSKCKCIATADGFRMEGQGTQGTATGLRFTCRNIRVTMPDYTPSSCTCFFKANIAGFGSKTREFTRDCDCFNFADQDPVAEIGTLHDFETQFPNTDGPKVTAWEFNLQAKPAGQETPSVIVGGWHAVSVADWSEGINQKTTWNPEVPQASRDEVRGTFTERTNFGFQWDTSLTPDLTPHSWLDVLTKLDTNTWKKIVTRVYDKTEGGHKDPCQLDSCLGGIAYRWQTSITGQHRAWGGLFDSCTLVCMPSKNQRPMCPAGACCNDDFTAQCARCSVEWCNKTDPACPFHNPEFKAGCNAVNLEVI